MVQIDLVTVLGDCFPRGDGGILFYHLHAPRGRARQIWHLVVQSLCGTTRFILVLTWRRASNRRDFTLSISATGMISMHSAGIAWLMGQLDALNREGVPNRFTYRAIRKEAENELHMRSAVHITMNLSGAERLAAGEPARIKEFMPVFERGLLQIASDVLALPAMCQRFEQRRLELVGLRE